MRSCYVVVHRHSNALRLDKIKKRVKLNGGATWQFGQVAKVKSIIMEKNMTPAIQTLSTSAIQKQITIQSPDAAEQLGDTITQIAKKIIPFPQNLPRPKLLVSIDLGKDKWVVVIQSATKCTSLTLHGRTGKMQRLVDQLFEHMQKNGIADTGEVMVCHEIGADGLWIKEHLNAKGFPCIVFNPDVLLVESNGRRKAKTDGIDAAALNRAEGHIYDGILCEGVVHMPASAEVRDARRVARFREQMLKERTRASNQFKSLLSQFNEVPAKIRLAKIDVGKLTDSLGNKLPDEVRFQLGEYQRLYIHFTQLVKGQETKLKSGARKAKAGSARRKGQGQSGKPRTAGTPVPKRSAADMEDILSKLLCIRGIGYRFAWTLAYELYHKTFFTVHQVNSATGLVDTPRASGSSQRSRGISRQSSSRLRATLVELAWLWLRHQPNSDITAWFLSRTKLGVAQRRMKKVAIVAVARRIAVALWKYLDHDEIPQGVAMRTVA